MLGWAMRWQEGSGMAVSEIAALSKQSTQVVTRMRTALPLAGIVLALLVNAAWIAFLGYWLLRLI